MLLWMWAGSWRAEDEHLGVLRHHRGRRCSRFISTTVFELI